MKDLASSIRIVGMRSRQRLPILLFLVFFFSVSQASAYINPGTASIVWQLMLSILLGFAYFAHIYWSKIKNAIQKK
jgi:hypothetical protein